MGRNSDFSSIRLKNIWPLKNPRKLPFNFEQIFSEKYFLTMKTFFMQKSIFNIEILATKNIFPVQKTKKNYAWCISSQNFELNLIAIEK